MSIGLRIREIRSKNNLNQADFSDRIGIKQSPLSQMESGKILPSIETLSNIIREFNISYYWLIDGEGEMLKKTGDINIQGNNTGIANTGIIAGSPMVGDGQNISDSNITIEGNVSYPAKETNTSDIKDMLNSYNTDKSVEIDRLQAVYNTMLEGKDAIILEKNNTIQKLEDQIQNIKDQIEELREDKKYLKQALQKNQM